MSKVGAGKYIYTLRYDWAKLPEGESFGAVTDVAGDSKNRIYVLQRKDPPVVIFDHRGNYLGSWGSGMFNRAHSIHIENDLVYLTDSDDSVCLIYTLNGRPTQVLGNRGIHSDTGSNTYGALVPKAGGPFNHPTKLVPAPWGELYVSDGEINCRIHRFTSDGHLINSWGEPGKMEPYQFHMPHSVLIDKNKVYVCDRENSRIHVYSAIGQFISMWTDLRPPTDICVDKDGLFYVSQFAFNITHRYSEYPPPTGSGSALRDSEGLRTIRPDAPPQISILDGHGEVITQWESRKAHGLWVDSRGNIYSALEDDRSVDKYVRQS